MNKQTTGIFIDLDGTLLNDKYEISEFDFKVLKKLMTEGFRIYLITGKSMVHAAKFYQDLGLKTFLVTSGGQVISQTQKIVWQKNLTNTNVKKMLNSSNIQTLLQDYLIQTNQLIYADNLKSPLINLFYEDNFKVQQYKNEAIEDIVGLYLNIKYDRNIKLWQLIEDLNKQWKNQLEFHPWEILKNIIILHVVPSGINKWEAIKKIIKWDKLNDVIAFGNGRNDIPVLKNTELSFAMKNATEEVKKYAKNVTEFDNNHSGVGRALKKYLTRSCL